MTPGARPVYATREFAELLKRRVARRYIGDGRIVVSATDDSVSISLADSALRGLIPTSPQTVRWGRVTGFTTGLFGGVDTALRVRPLRSDGSDDGVEDITVYVRSFGSQPDEYGRIRLTTSGQHGAGGAYPLRAVGSRVWFARMPYAGETRHVDIDTYFARGCP